MMKISAFLIFLFSSQMAMPQLVEVKEKVSGYLGKRLIVGMNGYFSLSNKPQKWDSDKYITLNKSFHLSTQYTLTNRVSSGLAFGMSQTSVDISLASEDYHLVELPETRFPYEYWSMGGRPLIRDRVISLEIRRFRQRKGAVSPFGSYLSTGLNFHNVNIDLSKVQFRTHKNGYIAEEIPIEDPQITKTLAEFHVGFGVAKPIWNGIFLDLGIKSGFIFNSTLLQQYLDVYEITPLRDKLYEYSIQRLAKRELINFKLGLQFPIK